MADEVEQIPVEHQSNAGKWILMVLGILAVVAFGYAHYVTHEKLEKLSEQLGASRARSGNSRTASRTPRPKRRRWPARPA